MIEQPSSSTVAAPHRAHSSAAHRSIKEPFRGRTVPPADDPTDQNYFSDRTKQKNTVFFHQQQIFRCGFFLRECQYEIKIIYY
jgi:hypothetical protein